MIRVFPKSANQPNEMALTICTSISSNCFRLMRDWKLESLANGKEISAVPFRTEKERSTSEGTPQFPNGISGKLPYHLTSNRNFQIFSPNGKHPMCQTAASSMVHLGYFYTTYRYLCIRVLTRKIRKILGLIQHLPKGDSDKRPPRAVVPRGVRGHALSARNF